MLASDAVARPSSTGLEERQAHAASAFWGFYLWRTRATQEYCAAFGISLTQYAAEFSRQHEREMAAASAIYTELGLTQDDSWTMLAEYLHGVVAEALGDQADAPPAETLCRAIRDYSPRTIAAFHLSSSLPEVHAALMAPR